MTLQLNVAIVAWLLENIEDDEEIHREELHHLTEHEELNRSERTKLWGETVSPKRRAGLITGRACRQLRDEGVLYFSEEWIGLEEGAAAWLQHSRQIILSELTAPHTPDPWP